VLLIMGGHRVIDNGWSSCYW